MLLKAVRLTSIVGTCWIATACVKSSNGIIGRGRADWMTQGQLASIDDLDATSTEYFDQRVDHLSSTDSRTFKQRFFVNSQYATTSDAPVFLLICGEGPCSANAMNVMLPQHAAKFGAHMIALEHRYYGTSFPVPDLTMENLKYLSTDQALEDLAAFISAMKVGRNMKGPWIAVGGSYPGSLSAYLRAKRPDLVIGSLASSAPVKAKEDFEEYDAHSALVLGDKCAAGLRKFIAAVDDAIDANGERLKELKSAMGIPNQASATEIADALSSPLGGFAQEGQPTNEFCAAAESDDPVKTLSAYYKSAFAENGGGEGNNGDGFGDVSSTVIPPEETVGGRMWLYQMCTEYGYFPVAHHDRTKSIYSRYLTLEHSRNQTCVQLFGLKGSRAVEATNQKYYEKLLTRDATRILFTNGQFDPWSTLSFTATPEDGSTRDIKAYVIDGAFHCQDMIFPMEGDSDSLNGARKLFQDLVAKWLASPEVSTSTKPGLRTQNLEFSDFSYL